MDSGQSAPIGEKQTTFVAIGTLKAKNAMFKMIKFLVFATCTCIWVVLPVEYFLQLKSRLFTNTFKNKLAICLKNA